MTELILESPHQPKGFHSVEWSTPPSVFRGLDDEFHFTLDACASPENAKCARFFTVEQDGLTQEWGAETVWCNPPYGRGQIERWLRKAWQASGGGATVVMLLPSDTGTSWWHDYCARGECRFLRGRVRFGGGSGSPTFASVVVIFRGAR